MLKHTLAAISCTFAVMAAPAFSSVGQPFFIVEADTSGSILDFFDFGAPSGLKEISAAGTITEAFGVTGFVGGSFNLQTSISGDISLEVNGQAIDNFGVGSGGPFHGGPLVTDGAIRFELPVFFPDDMSSVFDPVTGDEIYTINPFGGDVSFEGVNDVFLFLGISIFFEDPLPTKLFTDSLGDIYNYIEGPFTPTRIEFGIVGGPDVPVSAVPLPATFPLIAFGLTALAFMRRRVS